MQFPALYLTMCYRSDPQAPDGYMCRHVQCSRYPQCLRERCQAIFELYNAFNRNGIDYQMMMRQQGYDPADKKEVKK